MKKLMKFSSTIVAFILLVAFSVPAAFADDYSGPKPLSPQLSSDGMTLYNGIPVVVYKVDPNPPPQTAHIPAPAYLRTLPERAATATFSITYVANGGTDNWGAACATFPEAAKTAFNAAAAIWGRLLVSSVPITINACWSSSLDAGTLGYSGGGPLKRDFSGAPRANTWYSGSLANAIAGSDLDPTLFDMHITYNRTFSWYYGTDGTTPAGQYDLMSVVLHEIAHGLNFSGSMAYSGGSGSWGYATVFPNIYDTLMKDGAGVDLTNTATYPNPSVALGGALTSGGIWFHGANAMTANGASKVKMYAPGAWASGSSYSHLDYATFSGGAHRLMVYAISSATSTHDPGSVTLGIFKDLGWTITTSDVTIDIAASPNPVTKGSNLTYTITVSKNGLGAATGVSVTDVLPASVTYVSATPSQGTCGGVGTVTCPLGTINEGNNATVTIVATATVTGTLNNTASVASTPAPTSGDATATTTVSDPPPPAAPSAPSGGGGGGGGCFIATAAFGSPLDRHVQILRDFRDGVLLNCSAGKAFVQFYYRTSPSIADTISRSEGLRAITRVMLMPVIGVAYLIAHLGMLMTTLLFIIIALTLIFTSRTFIRKIMYI